jgi:hypothetical protein
MNRNRNRNYEENYGNQGSWGDQNAFARNESAWNRGNVDSPGSWGQSWGANWGTGAPGSGYEGSDYQRENRERNMDYNPRQNRQSYNPRNERGFFQRAGDTVREGWNRAGEVIREGWDRATDWVDNDTHANRGQIDTGPTNYNREDYGYGRRGQDYGGERDYGQNAMDQDNYGRSVNRERTSSYNGRDNELYNNRRRSGIYESDKYSRGNNYTQSNYNKGPGRNRRDQDEYYSEERNQYNDFNRSWDR